MFWSKAKIQPISAQAEEIPREDPRVDSLKKHFFSFGVYRMPTKMLITQSAATAAASMKAEMLQNFGLTVSAVFFVASKEKNTYISGTDQGIQLDQHKIYEAVFIPEGCTWKPAHVILSAQKVKEMKAKHPARAPLLDKYLKQWASV